VRTPRRRGGPVTSRRKHRGILKESDDLFRATRSRAFSYLVLTGSKRRAILFENGTANTFENECEHALDGWSGWGDLNSRSLGPQPSALDQTKPQPVKEEF
jgi:hypothetical protein